MESLEYPFRLADEILANRPAASELRKVVREITRSDVLSAQARLASQRKRAPAGAQTAVNQVFKDKLLLLGWEPEPKLFRNVRGADLAGWAMDFTKSNVGVEVSFNHAEAIAWTFVRLNLAGESTDVQPGSRIDVGVAIYPTRRFKTWGRMDSAVGVYERATQWLERMKPVLPIPVLVIGLDPNWEETDTFRGTAAG